MFRMLPILACGLLATSSLISVAQAQDVNLTADKAYVDVKSGDQIFRIERIQDQNNVITGAFAKTSRKCPPFCIQPLHAHPDVKTVSEYEFIEFVEQKVNTGQGLIIDARTPSWHTRGTIPGAINMPFTIFSKDLDDLELVEALEKTGAVPRKEGEEASGGFSLSKALSAIGLNENKARVTWDFGPAKQLLLWCNGPWCGQSPRAINGLIKLGYPPEKLRYYRGGMQMWQVLGLTTVKP